MLLLNGNMPDWLRNAEIIEENKVSDAIRDTVRNADLEIKAKTDVNIADLKKQWKDAAGEFTARKWIFRYIDEKQKTALQKHIDNLTAEKVYYSVYKRSFAAICKFVGIPADKVIIEWVELQYDKQQKCDKIAVRFTKGRVKVKIPEGVQLIHVSPVEGITELEPTFRSKSAGKFLYPTKRVYFTVAKEINAFKLGVDKKTKTYKYTPKNYIDSAYIDSSYASFAYGSVFVETDNPIPVVNMKRKMKDILEKL